MEEQERQDKRIGKRSVPLLTKTLWPMVLLAMLQILIFIAVLAWNGGFAQLKNYAYNIIYEKTENRKNYVESMMNQKTAMVYETASQVNALFEKMLQERGKTVHSLKVNKELNRELLAASAEPLISLLRRNMVNDAFLILDTGELYSEKGRRQLAGIYLRDTDVSENSVQDNKDIFMEMGSSSIAKDYGLPLDSGWTLYLDVTNASQADFCLRPMETYADYADTPLYNLGYWSALSRISDSQQESVKYTLPLVSEGGEVYGALGIGLLAKTIQQNIPAGDFSNESASYILSLDAVGDGIYLPMLHTGPAFGRLVKKETALSEARPVGHNLYDFTASGGAPCLGSIRRMNLYNSGSPYRNQRWALISVADRERSLGIYNAMMRTLALSIVVTLALCIVFAAVISQRINRPVRRMAKELAEGGQELVQFSSSGIAEMDALAQAITDLQRQVAKLKDDEYTAQLLAANAALQEAYAAATSANHAKTDFLSRMSHDIRTPMNAIIGMTAIAQRHMDDRNRLLDCLAKIAISSRYLLGLINEVLDMSKIEAGKLVLAKENMNLLDLVDALRELIRPNVREKGHSLQVRANQVTHENVVCDSLRLQQVFMNIASNAVKYTPAGGHIDIQVSEKPSGKKGTGCYEFVFADDGMGMSPEFLEKIFNPFERAEDVRVNKEQGTGLGMSITYNIVKLMGGDIQVESKEGQGSRFTVTLYLPFGEAEQEAKKPLQGIRALVAEGEEAVCQEICAFLAEAGAESEGVSEGALAVEKALAALADEENVFQVAVLDWKLTGPSGRRVGEELSERLGKDAPCIIYIGSDSAEAERETAGEDMGAFLTKPIFRNRLVTALTSLLEADQGNSLFALKEQDFSGHRILVAEDNELNREIAAEIFGMAGLTVDMAVDGKEAFDKFAASEPGCYEIVFMDIQMPVMNGYEASRKIRALQREDAARVPIVAMTANAFAEDIQDAEAAGMNEHVAKPLDLAKLFETVARYIR